MLGRTTPTGESIQNLLRERRGKVVASFDLITSSGIRIPGLTLIEGENGPFVSVPSIKTSKGWKSIITLPSYVRKELEVLVINELKRLSAAKKQKPQKAWLPPEKSPRAQKEAEYLERKKN